MEKTQPDFREMASGYLQKVGTLRLEAPAGLVCHLCGALCGDQLFHFQALWCREASGISGLIVFVRIKQIFVLRRLR